MDQRSTDRKKEKAGGGRQVPGVASSLEVFCGAICKDHFAFAAEVNEPDFFNDAKIDNGAFVADNDGRCSQRAFLSLCIESDDGAVSAWGCFRPARKGRVGERASGTAADAMVI